MNIFKKLNKIYIKLFIFSLLAINLTLYSVFLLSSGLRKKSFHNRFDSLKDISETMFVELMNTKIEIDKLKGVNHRKDFNNKDLEKLKHKKHKKLKEMSQMLAVDIIVVDSLNQVITCSFSEKNILSKDYLRIINHNNNTSNERDNFDMKTYIKIPIKTPSGHSFSFFLIPPQDDTSEEIRLFHLGLSVLGLILGVLTFLVTKWLTKPLREVHECVEEITTGNFSARIKYHGSDEIGELAKVFNKMIKSIENTLNNSKTVMANISHELRSPLARIQLSKEIINDLFLCKITDENIKNELKEYLNSISKEITDMDSMIDTLLNFFKSENIKNRLDKQKRNLLPIITSLCLDFEKNIYLDNNNIELKINNYIPQSTMYNLTFNPEVKLAFSNLLNNSQKYVNESGIITITLNLSDKFNFIIENTLSSRDFELLKNSNNNLEKELFVPFFRANNSVNKKKGSGLGLSISKNIVETHDGEISVEIDDENKSIRFKVII